MYRIHIWLGFQCSFMVSITMKREKIFILTGCVVCVWRRYHVICTAIVSNSQCRTTSVYSCVECLMVLFTFSTLHLQYASCWDSVHTLPGIPHLLLRILTLSHLYLDITKIRLFQLRVPGGFSSPLGFYGL